MSAFINILFDSNIYVPHQREGEHIVFCVDPVGVDVSVGIGVTFLFAWYLMNRWVDSN